nr:polysaccharide pyruvyl transferase family protein [Mesobacterium pallidum]
MFTPAYSGMKISSTAYRARSTMPLETFSTLAGLALDEESVTPNNGNMIHAESAARIFACDLQDSTIGRLPGLPPKLPPQQVKTRLEGIARNFDAVVLNFANIIRARAETTPAAFAKLEQGMASTARQVRSIQGPKIYAFGIGLQDDIPPDPALIGPELLGLLKALQERAAIIGTRGERTAGFLQALGIDRAQALGCPSLYVAPDNVRAIRPGAPHDGLRVTAAGRLSTSGSAKGRIQGLARMAAEFDTDFTFQNDLYQLFPDPVRDATRYNSETHEVDKAACDAASVALGLPNGFARYYYFRSPIAWRAYAGTRDVYLGDRFHGGVAFLQAGLPAGFVYDDVRVKELAGFFDLPAFSRAELDEIGPRAALERVMSEETQAKFQETYARRCAAFARATAAAGLPVRWQLPAG